jgi:hypothetical protein
MTQHNMLNYNIRTIFRTVLLIVVTLSVVALSQMELSKPTLFWNLFKKLMEWSSLVRGGTDHVWQQQSERHFA